MRQSTRDSQLDAGGDGGTGAGVLVVWSGDTPRLLTLRVPAGGLILGRDTLAETGDDRLSRQHARIRWNGARFQVTDLGSRNGTFVGGSLVADGEVTALPPVVVRTGRTISILCSDIGRYEGATVTADGAVIGPTVRPAWDAVTAAAREGTTLLLTGERGTGKTLAARAFHAASAATGALVAIDCATIPPGTAERLLIGTRATTGGDADVDGYLAAAAGGTLFLDDIAALDLSVQAALLRVFESGELRALGASRPRPVAMHVVGSTHHDLRAEVLAGRFSGELLEWLGRPEVRLPPLRDRVEDIAWLVAAAVGPSGLPAHPSLVEACLLRPWPGNVGELAGEVGRAAHASVEAARKAVRTEDLDGAAGRLIASGELQTLGPNSAVRTRPPTMPDPATIVAVLRAESGNLGRAARRLGLHRTQLERYIATSPEAAALVTAEPGDDDDEDVAPGTIA